MTGGSSSSRSSVLAGSFRRPLPVGREEEQREGKTADGKWRVSRNWDEKKDPLPEGLPEHIGTLVDASALPENDLPAHEWIVELAKVTNIMVLRKLARTTHTTPPPTGSTRELWLAMCIDSLMVIPE